MPNAYNYSNVAIQTTLAGNISSGATSLTVTATTGFPSSTPYILAVDYGAVTEELVSVTGVAGTTLTVTRGFGGTSAQSHSIGAVVRHVVNAVDLTDFRTHEAATASVHGVTGALVGATQTQTLTNKTLTSPTINGATLSGTLAGSPTLSGTPVFSAGAALAGTFTGTPTLSGAVVLSGTPNISNGAALAGTFSGSPTFSGAPVFSGAVSVTGGLTLTGTSALAERALVTDNAYRARVTADTNSRWLVNADGKQVWGPGNATGDTNLYRSAADTLATDDAFSVGTDLTVGTTTWTSFTPTWTIGGSPPTTTNVGWYKKIGKIVFFEIYTVWGNLGSGSTQIQGNLPTTPYRDGAGANTTRQVILGWVGGLNTLGTAVCMGQVLAGGAGTAFVVALYNNTAIQAAEVQSNTIMTLQGWYREA